MRRIRLIAVASLVFGLFGQALPAAESSNLEYRVKATFLHKFADFVTWPDAAFATDLSPLAICVVGRDPFGAILDEAVRDQHFGTRSIIVKRLAAGAAAKECHIAFVAGMTSRDTEAMLAALHGNPVLTVTDSTITPDQSGVISFVIFENRVRFAINSPLATADGLNISSKLQSVAVSAQVLDRSKAR